jgi:CheY-like chemotaxis protein
VLVVDDDPVCLFVAQRMLQKLGLAVDASATGIEAMEMAARWRYAAVFMDCVMPDIDGYSAAQGIRAKDELSTSPPVIAVTSHPRCDCLAAGMDHHMPKPLRLDTLRSDCAMLGLIAADGLALTGAHASPPEPAALELPLLEARPGPSETRAADLAETRTDELTETRTADLAETRTTDLAETRTAELAEMVVERAVPYLAGLWRASNARDLDPLARLALELKQRATSVGAVRVAELCEELATAAAHGNVDTAVGLERHIRRAVQQTAAAA